MDEEPRYRCQQMLVDASCLSLDLFLLFFGLQVVPGPVILGLCKYPAEARWQFTVFWALLVPVTGLPGASLLAWQ